MRAAVLLILCASAALADDSEIPFAETLEVEGRADDLVGVADSASQGTIGAEDLAKRPLLRAGELLEAVPGVIVTQHSGGGKANQYFLRGFNLDHGTDFVITIDGMPINMPSHGHGQGYADLGFMIPELIGSERYAKGPYDSRRGDFSSAGGVDIDLVDRLERGLFRVTPGEIEFLRVLAADSFEVGRGSLTAALEYQADDGPWTHPDDLDKRNGLIRFVHEGQQNRFSLTAMAYDANWNSTDQIPRRAVASGLLGRFDAIDESDGGESSRSSLSSRWRRFGERSLLDAYGFLIDYDLNLYSNFTYFLDDPVAGDQFQQFDDRRVWGGGLSRTHFLGANGPVWEWSYGLQLRHDAIDNGLNRTRRRELISRTRADQIDQWGGGAFIEARTKLTPWLRVTAGGRVDRYRAEVETAGVGTADVQDTLVSPKLNLAFGPWRDTDLYLNLGRGFHSNDARGAVVDADPLVPARGVDLGVRIGWIEGLQSSATLFWLELDSEILFIGDAGTTEASRPSRRTGIEWANFWTPNQYWTVDFDLALSRARFQDDAPEGDRIPGSIETAITAGAALSDWHRFSAAVRLRYFGSRPLIEDNSVRSRPSTLVYGELGWRLNDAVRIALQGFNLINEQGSDIDYFYESQLAGEAAPVEDVHFHPAEPRTFRLSVSLQY
jgi:outer membrane receptor protein involved in Fe transport